jgi:hypothetical protein
MYTCVTTQVGHGCTVDALLLPVCGSHRRTSNRAIVCKPPHAILASGVLSIVVNGSVFQP